MNSQANNQYYDFQAVVRAYFRDHGRHDLPWRQPGLDGSFDPYHILVSELMLQQTQVARVLPKYEEFLTRFPTIDSLAAAEVGEVLRQWSGLGYNRRAKFLWQAAQEIMGSTFAGQTDHFPRQSSELVKLPGIGPNTAGAILAYAFDQPVVFVETNIRTVFIHHFFAAVLAGAADTAITDRDILALVAATLDHEHPREWYWALMDYGSYLKRTVGNRSRHSATYARQSTFQGSSRQLRGQVIQLLGNNACSSAELRHQIHDARLPAILEALLGEGLIRRQGRYYCL